MQMVVRASASKISSSSSLPPPAERRDDRRAKTTRVMMMDMGRRGLLLSTVVAASQVSDSKTELLQTILVTGFCVFGIAKLLLLLCGYLTNLRNVSEYLKKSQENKAKNDKERLDSYYKRNYKEYFEFVEGSLQGKKEELTESEKGILDWLKNNK